MSTLRILVLGLGAAVLVLLGMTASWIPRPSWARTWHILGIVGALLVASVVLAIVDAGQSGPTPPPLGRSRTVRDLLSDLADHLLLTIDRSTGYPALFASHVDRTNRQHLWNIGSTVNYESVPDASQIIVPVIPKGAQHARLELHEVNGDLKGVLTRPPSSEDDGSPALARGPRAVFFVRTTWRDVGGGTSVVTGSKVLRVPLDGSTEPVRVDAARGFGTVSIDDAATTAAGSCANREKGAPQQTCVVDLRSGRREFIPGSEGASTGDAAVSPDGRLVAHASVATNPYGIAQIYVFDRTSKRVTLATKLPGTNTQPAWVRGSAVPCFLFHHAETGVDAIYLTCLGPRPATVPAIAVGERPVWFDG